LRLITQIMPYIWQNIAADQTIYALYLADIQTNAADQTMYVQYIWLIYKLLRLIKQIPIFGKILRLITQIMPYIWLIYKLLRLIILQETWLFDLAV